MNAIKWNQRHTRDECIDKIFTFYARVSCKRRNFFMKVNEMMSVGGWDDVIKNYNTFLEKESMKSAPFLLAIIVPLTRALTGIYVNVHRVWFFFSFVFLFHGNERKIQFSYYVLWGTIMMQISRNLKIKTIDSILTPLTGKSSSVKRKENCLD